MFRPRTVSRRASRVCRRARRRRRLADLEYVEIEHRPRRLLARHDDRASGERRLRSGHDLETRTRARSEERGAGGPALRRRRAESATELDAAAIGADVADADEEGAAAAVLDDAREVLGRRRVRRWIGQPIARSEKSSSTGERARAGAAAAPGRHAVLAQRRASARDRRRASRRAARPAATRRADRPDWGGGCRRRAGSRAGRRPAHRSGAHRRAPRSAAGRRSRRP